MSVEPAAPSGPLADNPFFVLELAPTCGPMEVERAGSKLAGMVALKLKSAASYDTPLGSYPRNEPVIREAVGQLADPNERVFFEVWAGASQEDVGTVPSEADKRAQPRVSWWRCGE